MKTTYHVIRPDKPETTHDIEWPEEPGYDRIKVLVEPLLGKDEPLEHVTVLHKGKRADMFVSELGQLKLTWRGPLPFNRAATAIYRNAWLSRNPGEDPDSLPTIAGVAVLFDRIVWT